MAIEGFIELTTNILMYTPPSPAISQLVVLATWMGAADKHIAKYTTLYQRLIPTSRILLLKSHVSGMISPYKAQEVAIEPAANAVQSILAESTVNPQTKPIILVHMFSNGGINSATHLLKVLSRKRKQPTPLVGLICDSVPTGAGYWKTYSAFTHSFPQGFPLNIVTSSLIHILLMLLFASIYSGRYEHPEDFWRKAILDETLVDSKRICYIASKADKMTDWRDVVEHAAVARGKGWEVREIILKNTPHCNHLSKDPELYHQAITDTLANNKL